MISKLGDDGRDTGKDVSLIHSSTMNMEKRSHRGDSRLCIED
jgi:hypothetical protein